MSIPYLSMNNIRQSSVVNFWLLPPVMALIIRDSSSAARYSISWR